MNQKASWKIWDGVRPDEIHICILMGDVLVRNVNIKITKSAQRHNIRHAEPVFTYFLALWGQCSFFITLFQSAEIQSGSIVHLHFAQSEGVVHCFFLQDIATWIVCKYATHFGTGERGCINPLSQREIVTLSRHNLT